MPREFARKSRIDSQLQRELIAVIRDELTDPRVAKVTVTRADVSPDMRNARVLVSVLGDDARLESAVQALNHAAGRLRHGLGQRMRLRHVPQLHFAVDVQLLQASRVNQVLGEALREDRTHAARRNDEPQ